MIPLTLPDDGHRHGRPADDPFGDAPEEDAGDTLPAVAPENDVFEGILASHVDDDAGGTSHLDPCIEWATREFPRRVEGSLRGVTRTFVPRLRTPGERPLTEARGDRIDDVQESDVGVGPLFEGELQRRLGLGCTVERNEDVVWHASPYARRLQKRCPATPNWIGVSLRELRVESRPMPERTTFTELDGHPHAEVFEARRPRTVRLELDAGETVPRHTHEGTNVVLHVVHGRLELVLDDETYDLRAGAVIRFDGDREISPTAVVDTTALAVFAPTP